MEYGQIILFEGKRAFIGCQFNNQIEIVVPSNQDFKSVDHFKELFRNGETGCKSCWRDINNVKFLAL